MSKCEAIRKKELELYIPVVVGVTCVEVLVAAVVLSTGGLVGAAICTKYSYTT